jgi:hypothetical protein
VRIAGRIFESSYTVLDVAGDDGFGTAWKRLLSVAMKPIGLIGSRSALRGVVAVGGFNVYFLGRNCSYPQNLIGHCFLDK